jgi:hypothetical protein
MDKAHQLELLSGAARDYQDGLMSLGILIQKIEGVLEVLNDRTLKDQLFSALLALEEVYARTRIGDFDYNKYGKAVVDRAVDEIISKTESYSARRH